MHPTLLKIESDARAKKGSFFLIAGPCVIEDENMGFEIAHTIMEITQRLDIPYIFKASYKKANRSRKDSFTGIGDKKALEILGKISKQYNIPVITDVHTEEDAALAARYVDVLQIPAFLCRQTDLLVAAARTGKHVNVKKGQFLAPESMQFVIDKIISEGNNHVWATERGTSFGYGDLVVDFRGIPVMQGFGVPVILDTTHSLQKPNTASGVTGGLPHLISTIASAGIAAGVDGIFLETHPEPLRAKSDGANMLPIADLESLLEKLLRVRKAIVTT